MSDERDLQEHGGASDGSDDRLVQESAAEVAAFVAAGGAVVTAGFQGISAYADMQMLRLERRRMELEAETDLGPYENLDLEPGRREPLSLEPREPLNVYDDWDWPSRY